VAKVAAENIPFGAPLDEVMSRDNPNVVSGGNPSFKSFGEEEQHSEMEKQGAAKEVTHAGLALLAKDTGRALVLQRALDDNDPAGGKFEFPGGGIEEGESPLEGAIREWKEETGCPLPPGQVTHDWLSNGMYRGFVYVVPSEDVLQINGSPGDRQVLNPDDPDQDNIEVALWMHPKDLRDHPATRKEVKSGTDWSVFGKARRRAAAAPASCECGHDQSEHSRGRGTCDSCWRHFMDHFQDYYQGIGPEVTYCKRYKGDRVKTAMSDRSEYGMQHSPDAEGPPVHALDSGYGPPDIYTHLHHYRTGDDESDAESMQAIREARGDKELHRRPAVDNAKWRERGHDFADIPEETEENFAKRQEARRNGEHKVTIYRSAPRGVKTFNHGDWVSLSPNYARSNGLHPDDPKQDMPTYKAQVKAKHVRWPADSINEFGYFGPEVPTKVHFRGGRNAPRVGPGTKEGAMKVSLRKSAAEEPELPSEALQRIFDEAEEESKRHQVPGLGRHPSEIDYQGGGKANWEEKHNLRNPDMTKALVLKGEPPLYRMNRRRQANDEIVVPRNIDTLRDSTCAVCGSVDSMNGDRCTVCGYMATPQAFQSPDTSLAPKVRDELGIGNPEADQFGGAPDAGLEGPPGAEEDLEGMGEGEEGPEGLEGDEDVPALICDNCGTTFDSEEEEEDLSEPYMSPAARIEPDVSALGVEDELEVAREVGQEENEAGTNEGVAYQEGDECPVCGIGILVPNEGPEEVAEGPPGEEDELGPPGEQEPSEEEGPPGEQEGPDDQEEAPPDEEEVEPPEDEDEQDEDTDEDGEDEDDQEEEDEGPPFRRQRKGSSTMAVTPRAQRPARAPVPAERQGPPPRRQASTPNPAAQERQRLFKTLEAQTTAINRQADRLEAQDRMLATMGRFVRHASTKITELSLRNETLERQMALVANASGLAEPLATIGAAGQARVATLYHRANPANPAQPVPEPTSEPPVATSQEAVQAQGRDDVTQLGASPVADVQADAVTSVDLPYGELANEPVGINRTDVTAPVQGTETATPPEMTVIPVDARIGNPNDPQVAFPFTVGPVGAPSRSFSGPSVGNPPTTAAQHQGEPGVAVHPQAQAHYIASVNLARLRAQVGITNEEPFQLGTKIAASMSDAQINAEAQGLQAVASRQAAQPPPQYFAPGPAFEPVQATGTPDTRPMVPHMATTSGNGSVLPADPSFQAGKYGPGPGAAIQGTTLFAPRADEFGWDSPV
jgi:8-oxo-dGTP pyrophosphatase MutT (NUDIX family)